MFGRMGNDGRLRGCYVWQARNIKFGSLVKRILRGAKRSYMGLI